MRYKDESGYVLAATLGAVVLVTAIAMSSYLLSQRALEQAGTTAQSSAAYQLANSALEYEVSRYENGGDLYSQYGKTLPSGGTYDLITSGSGTDITIKCRARAGKEVEAVSVKYTVFDLSETVYSGGGNSLFAGSSFNAKDSMIIGALYLKLPAGERVNSCPSFVDGPLFVENAVLSATNAVTFVPPAGQSKYQVYADVTPSIASGNVQSNPLTKHMTPPELSMEFINQLYERASAEGHYYSATSAAGVNIGGTSSPIPATNGVLTGSGTIFVDGTAVIDSSVKSYKGNWTIYATNGIIARGRLIPSDYATNPAAPPSGSYDSYYSSIISGKSDELPQARPDNCITLITPKDINSTWAATGNSTTRFSFCGAMYAGGTIAFQESLRGSIIACFSLAPDKKTILATQKDLRDCLSEDAQQLFSKAMTKGAWMRLKY